MCQTTWSQVFWPSEPYLSHTLKLLFFIKPFKYQTQKHQWHFSLQDVQASWILFEGDCPKLLLDTTKKANADETGSEFLAVQQLWLCYQVLFYYVLVMLSSSLRVFKSPSGCNPRHQTLEKDVLTSLKNIGSTRLSSSFSASRHITILCALWCWVVSAQRCSIRVQFSQ